MTPEQSYALFMLAVVRKALDELGAEPDPASIPVPDDDDLF